MRILVSLLFILFFFNSTNLFSSNFIAEIEKEISNCNFLLELYSKNIISVNYYGYKKNISFFYDEGTRRILKSFSQGKLIQTGRKLDIAIINEGFIKL